MKRAATFESEKKDKIEKVDRESRLREREGKSGSVLGEKPKAKGERIFDKLLNPRMSVVYVREREWRKEKEDGKREEARREEASDRKKDEPAESLLSLSLDFALSFAFSIAMEYGAAKSQRQAKGLQKMRRHLKAKGQKVVFPDDVTTVSHIMYSINNLSHPPPSLPTSSSSSSPSPTSRFYQIAESRHIFPSVSKVLIMRVFHSLNTVTSLPPLIGLGYKKLIRSVCGTGERNRDFAIALAIALYQITCGVVKVIVLMCRCDALDAEGFATPFRWKERRGVGRGMCVSACNYYFCTLDWVAAQVFLRFFFSYLHIYIRFILKSSKAKPSSLWLIRGLCTASMTSSPAFSRYCFFLLMS